MGIKGIYRELGSGERVSLAKLSADHLQKNGRPLRLAIDIAIWQFQAQAARGGSNPAIRTLFYRLVRLLGLSIQPVFVFDGPRKPLFKRNKRSGRGDGVATAIAKRLIKLFGFPVHQAPGEAEAECALLQQHGIVDAVLSEDVDTIMFGCTRALRNWSAAGPRGAKTPTHVTMYRVERHSPPDWGLDREGMVLVALMSGGDYIPEGVPGCGVKLACEVARAGFGKSLCLLKAADQSGIAKWRESLRDELRTNKSGFFRTKHKALSIPEEFPNMQALRHYTHPVVSGSDAIGTLKAAVDKTLPIDVAGLRAFVEETFDWTTKLGAVKLIRVLSPSLLARQLLDRSKNLPPAGDSADVQQKEQALVRSIKGRRMHFSVDGMPELRVSHTPTAIVPLDLSHEVEEEAIPMARQGLALNSDDEFDAVVGATQRDMEAGNSRPKNTFDPTMPQPVWIAESLVRLGAPLCVQDWEEKQQARTTATAKGKAITSRTGNGATKGKGPKDAADKQTLLDTWVRTTKRQSPDVQNAQWQSQQPKQHRQLKMPPPLSPPDISQQQVATQSLQQTPAKPRRILHTQVSVSPSKPLKPTGKAIIAEPKGHRNPRTIAGSQLAPRTTKTARDTRAIVISSSPEYESHSSVGDPLTYRLSADPVSPLRERPRHVEPSTPKHSKADSGPFRETLGSPADESGSPSKRAKQTGGSLKQSSIMSFVQSDSLAGDSVTLQSTTPDDPFFDSNIQRQSRQSASSMRSVTALFDKHKLSSPDGRVTRSRDPNSYIQDAGDMVAEAAVAVEPPKLKVLAPRTSAFGFFKEIEICPEEADSTSAGFGGRRGTLRENGVWRRSDVSVVDLTGDD